VLRSYEGERTFIRLLSYFDKGICVTVLNSLISVIAIFITTFKVKNTSLYIMPTDCVCLVKFLQRTQRVRYAMNRSVFVMETDYCAQGSEIWCTIIKGTLSLKVGRDSSVGIAIATAWTVWGMNPGGGEIFGTRTNRSWGPPSLLCNGYWVSFPGVKGARRGFDHPPHLSRIKKEYS
jgi:hypothetical protein